MCQPSLQNYLRRRWRNLPCTTPAQPAPTPLRSCNSFVGVRSIAAKTTWVVSKIVFQQLTTDWWRATNSAYTATQRVTLHLLTSLLHCCWHYNNYCKADECGWVYTPANVAGVECRQSSAPLRQAHWVWKSLPLIMTLPGHIEFCCDICFFVDFVSQI